LVGLILGIVALVRGRGNPLVGGQGLAIAAIVIAVVATPIALGMETAVAIPAFLHYIRQTKTAEAHEQVSRLCQSVGSYFDQSHRLPDPAPLTPAVPCSTYADGRCPPAPGEWGTPAWQALGFSMTEPHYYQYELLTDGTSFTAHALGDLDADGMRSTFECHGQVVGGVLQRDPTVTATDEIE
jgi:hypothetical protein